MFTYKRRVNFYDTDLMGVVHHANYIRYFEEARVEYLRAAGWDLMELMDEGIVFPIVEVEAKYKESARYDEIILIHTYMRNVDRVKLEIEYEAVSEKTGRVLATGRTVNTFTDTKTGRIVRLPKEKVAGLVEFTKGDRNGQ